MRHTVCVALFVCVTGHVVFGQSAQTGKPTAGEPEAAPAGTPTTETNAGLIVPFLEGTSVFFTLNGGTRFEADMVPHLFVYQNFSDMVDVNKQGTQRFAIVITGTTAVRIRMFNTDSAPVRTPSYMPRGNVQFLWARNLRCAFREQECSKPEEKESPRIALWEGHLTIGHHSNGQDGCLFIQNPPRVEGEECAPPPLNPGPADINRKDGSFSTNYLRAGMNHSWNRLRPVKQATTSPAGEVIFASYFEWTLRGEVEYHPLKVPGLHIHQDIAEDYGRTRLLGGTTWAWKGKRGCSRRLEIGAAFTRIIGAADIVDDWAASGQATCFPFSNGGWGFFVRAYRGQDYYNLGYLDNIARVHIGATFNQSDFFRFRHKPAK